MKFIGKILILGIGLFLAIQMVRLTPQNPPVTAEIQVPPDVHRILKNSCYNCHSNETQLPWFDRIAPASWLVAYDVKQGRARLNFSEIGKLPPAAQKAALFEAVNQIQLGAMPLPRYQRVHPESTITPEQLAVLKNYLQPFPEPAAATQPPPPSANPQPVAATPANVQPEWNGVPFFPDYKNWKTVSTTDRGDNHTMRVILGNDIAIHAIEAKQIRPWPDGAVFAKIAWTKAMDSNGIVHPGKFIQVEFMAKDQKKYASTAGWGWGRWRGMDLKPYGKDKSFTTECVGCHTPVRDNDYVYTQPVPGAR